MVLYSLYWYLIINVTDLFSTVIPTNRCFYAVSLHTWSFSIVNVQMNVMITTLHLLLIVIVHFRPPRESLVTSTINGSRHVLLPRAYQHRTLHDVIKRLLKLGRDPLCHTMPNPPN